MNTEKTKDSLVERRSVIGEILERTLFPVFLCVHRVSVVFFPVSTGEKHPRAEPSAALGCHIESTASSERACQVRHFGDGVGRPVSVPEGRRRRLAGGKSAPADAAPGNRAEWFRAPAGHRRNGLGCWPMAEAPACPRRRQELLRCPAGARSVRRSNRGPRLLAQACPRLISCGVPPGPTPRRRRQFTGSRLVASATAICSQRKAQAAPPKIIGEHHSRQSELAALHDPKKSPLPSADLRASRPRSCRKLP